MFFLFYGLCCLFDEKIKSNGGWKRGEFQSVHMVGFFLVCGRRDGKADREKREVRGMEAQSFLGSSVFFYGPFM